MTVLEERNKNWHTQAYGRIVLDKQWNNSLSVLDGQWQSQQGVHRASLDASWDLSSWACQDVILDDVCCLGLGGGLAVVQLEIGSCRQQGIAQDKTLSPKGSVLVQQIQMCKQLIGLFVEFIHSQRWPRKGRPSVSGTHTLADASLTMTCGLLIF